MKTLLVICLLAIAVYSPANSQTCTSTEHEQWMAKAVNETRTIRVGMSRRDLLKVFTKVGAGNLFFQDGKQELWQSTDRSPGVRPPPESYRPQNTC